MKLTKLEHACLVLEADGSQLVIDPGSFTLPLVDATKIVAVVITHEHADHWTANHLSHIVRDSPDVKLYGPAGVVAAASEFPIIEVTSGDVIEAGPFTLQFYGEKHAVIHSTIPVVDNIGVLVNDTLFYPGDAFTVPPFDVDVLGVPVGAPWLKIGEVIDYVTEVAPKRTFPTHEMVLSVAGKTMGNGRIEAAVTSVGGTAIVLEPGESFEL